MTVDEAARWLAPNLADDHPANRILDAYDNRFSMQLLWMF